MRSLRKSFCPPSYLAVPFSADRMDGRSPEEISATMTTNLAVLRSHFSVQHSIACVFAKSPPFRMTITSQHPASLFCK